jgi:NifU-like protein involved in Fe-S cluster formation
MVLGSKQIKRMTCVACNEIIGEHSFNGLGKCLVRIQASMMLEAQKNQKNREEANSTKDGIDALDKSNGDLPKSETNEGVETKNNVETSDGDLGFLKPLNNEITR